MPLDQQEHEVSSGQNASMDQKDKLITWILVAVVVLIGAGLSVYKLGAKSLGGDEITTVQIASRPVPGIYDSLEKEHQAPPLYYIVLHAFLKFGSDEFMVRLPSVLFFVLSIIACFLVARALTDRTVALTAAFLFALSPLEIGFAQDARMYSMCQLFLLLSFFFFIRAVQTKKTRLWIAYVAVSVISAYTHYFAVFYILSQGVCLTIFSIRQLVSTEKGEKPKSYLQPWIWMAVNAACILALYLPRFSSSQARSQGEGLDHSIPAAFNLILKLFGGDGNTWFVLYVLGFLSLWGFVALFLGQERQSGWILVLWALLPLPLIYLFLTLFDSFFAIRYVLFSHPPYLMAISFGSIYIVRSVFTRLKPVPWMRKPVGVCLVLLVLWGHAAPLQVMYDKPRQAWRELALFLREQVRADDVVLVTPIWFRIMLGYYGFPADRIVPTQLKDIEEILETNRDTWIVCSPTSHFHPYYSLRQEIEDRQCTIIFGDTYRCAGIYLLYLPLDKDDPRDMIPILKAATHILPKDWYVHALLAQTLESQGRVREAIREYERVLELEPHYLEFMKRLVRLYVDTRELSPAIRWMRRVLDINPVKADRYVELADILVQNREFAEALVQYENASRWNPEYLDKPWFHVRVGDALRLNGERARAIEAYEKALELDGDHRAALNKLERLRKK